jgi:hypothetical protein
LLLFIHCCSLTLAGINECSQTSLYRLVHLFAFTKHVNGLNWFSHAFSPANPRFQGVNCQIRHITNIANTPSWLYTQYSLAGHLCVSDVSQVIMVFDLGVLCLYESYAHMSPTFLERHFYPSHVLASSSNHYIDIKSCISVSIAKFVESYTQSLVASTLSWLHPLFPRSPHFVS